LPERARRAAPHGNIKFLRSKTAKNQGLKESPLPLLMEPYRSLGRAGTLFQRHWLSQIDLIRSAAGRIISSDYDRPIRRSGAVDQIS